ncbi:MAG TPA: DUF4912 domain-containing protein [Verrucomicrobiae bacterium]|nr:DUF4912 domain-containing protein [Verrucomicrobiae bacterium]
MNKADLLAKTKTELLRIAQRLGLRGVSTLKKEHLADRIHDAQQRPKGAPREPSSSFAQRVADAVKRRAVRRRADADEPRPSAAKANSNGKPRLPRPPKAPAAPATVVARDNGALPSATEISAHKFEVSPAPQPPRQAFYEEHLGELPDSYGTGRLFLTARDPHWLYAYWDLSWQQMADCRGQASDGRLLLRVYEKNHADPIQTLTLSHDSRNWYVPVNKAATSYRAELGYWQHDGHFHVVSHSRETTTPPDAVSPDTTARFVTIPIDIAFRDLFNIIRGHIRDGEALADALDRLQRAGFRFPFKLGLELGPWTPEQAAELERVLGGDLFRRIQMGSFEISEWLRRRMQEELSSGMFSAFSPGGSSWSGAPQKGFWFAVNAELIIYGATEPDAKVTVDGKPIKLRSDGTFSFHYSFPDGQYKLPVVAVSRDGDDKREAQLTFERQSRTKGEVGSVKQPAQLKSPAAA